MTGTFTDPACGRTRWRERGFVLGGLGLALFATLAAPALGADASAIGAFWAAAIVWTVLATLVGEAKIGGGWDFIAKMRADGSASWRGQTIGKKSRGRMKDYAESHQSLEWSQV